MFILFSSLFASLGVHTITLLKDEFINSTKTGKILIYVFVLCPAVVLTHFISLQLLEENACLFGNGP